MLVAGVLGPSGKLLTMGEVSREALVEAFAQQARALEQGGVDFFHVETMSDLEEAVAAVEGIRSVSALPVALTMSFDSGKAGAGLRTMMGVSARTASGQGRRTGPVRRGRQLRPRPRRVTRPSSAKVVEAAGQAVVIAKLNTGVPQMRDGQVDYGGSPEEMAGVRSVVRPPGGGDHRRLLWLHAHPHRGDGQGAGPGRPALAIREAQVAGEALLEVRARPACPGLE